MSLCLVRQAHGGFMGSGCHACMALQGSACRSSATQTASSAGGWTLQEDGVCDAAVAWACQGHEPCTHTG